jgi:non-heme chloroperoxidase
MRTRRATCALSILLVGTIPAWSQPAQWVDPSTHKATLVTVDDGVQLEVLDWGGSGPPIVLLAGLGDTAHVFDDFAPMLTARHRVVGITRRAHRGSSAPAGGYDFARLAEDVARAIESLGVTMPILVGHSIAGEELHVLGARQPAKIAGLVYIDAAFNRADGSEDYDAVARALPPLARPGPADLSSFAALRSFLEKNQGAAGPEAHLRARFIAKDDGTIAGPWAPDAPIRQTMTQAMQTAFKTYNPERVRVPALAIYAVPASAADLTRPWYPADDPAIRDRVQTLFRLSRERFARHAKWFGELAERGRVVELAGPHHLFLSHPREVLQEIETFATSLAPKR